MSDDPASQHESTGPLDIDVDGPTGRGTGPRSAFLVAGAIALVLVAGAVVIVTRLLGGGGTQPAAVLPDDAIAYVGVDLDPPAGQKIAAYQFLRAFPDLREDTPGDDEDPRRKLVAFLLEEGDCAALTWEDDVEPWLGQRAALVVRPGEDAPVPVFAVQVTDEAAARDFVVALDGCDGAVPDEPTGVAFSEGYAVVAETQAQADAAVSASASGALVDDVDYRETVEAVGDDGIVEGYLAPSFIDEIAGFAGDELSGSDLELFEEIYPESFSAAFTVRFDGGGLELVVANTLGDVPTATAGGAQLADLPADSILAVAGGIPEGAFGYFDTFVEGFNEGFEEAAGDGSVAPDLVQLLEDETGIRLPEDLETLVGTQLALAVGDDVVSSFIDGAEAPEPPPLAIGLLTDSSEAEVRGVVDKLNAFAAPLVVEVTAGEQGTAYALDPAWAQRLASGGGDTLGGLPEFDDVVGDVEAASSGFFVNLNGDWFDEVRAQLPAEIAAEVDDVVTPLSAVGVVTRVEGDLQISRLRVGTD